MNSVRYALFAICLITLSTRTEALDRSILLGSTRTHLIERIDEYTYIDWTAGYISSRALVKLPRIVFDSNHSDFGNPDTARSLSEARYLSRQKARETAEIRLMSSILKMPVDGKATIKEKMKHDMNLAGRMGRLSGYFAIKKVNTGEGYVSIELAMPFFSDHGLYSVLSDETYGSDRILEFPESRIRQKISGIVIDCSEFRDFTPTLEMRIFSDQGRQIYGPESLPAEITIRRGPGGFYRDQENAARDQRSGIAPYYLYAKSAEKGSIYLDSEEVKRILSSRDGQKALQTGKIIFLFGKKR